MKVDLAKLKIDYDIKNPNPNLFEAQFKALNPWLNDEEKEYCIRYAKNLLNNNVPVIFNVDQLSKELGYTVKHLYYLANNEETIYKSFYIKKKNGGKRQILVPDKRLKYIQRWILENILSHIPIHVAAMGFVKNRSIVNNAQIHVKNKIVLNIDIMDFFPSISYGKVYKVFSKIGYDRLVSKLLTNLCTYKGYLPQGSPASPMLSNHVCSRLDRRLNGFAKKYGYNYSRYADDITFSGGYSLARNKNFIIKIIQNEGFKIAFDKLRLTGNGGAQIVTGLTVNDKVGFDRKKMRFLRAMIHNCENKGPVEANKNDDPIFRERLYGYTAFLKPIKRELSQKWREILDNIDWSEYDKKYGLVVKDQEIVGFYKGTIKNRYWLNLRDLDVFSKIPKLEDISPEDRKRLDAKLDNLREKCSLKIKDKCKTCLSKIHGSEVHNCMKRIIAYFTGFTGGPHSPVEIGDAHAKYIVRSRTNPNKFIEKDKLITFVIKSGTLNRTKADTLLRQCAECLDKESIQAIFVVVPTEIDTSTTGLLAQMAGSRKKSIGILTRGDLICILKQYEDEVFGNSAN